MAAGPNNAFLPDRAEAKHEKGRSSVGPRPSEKAPQGF